MIFFIVVSGSPDGVARAALRLFDSLDATSIIKGERIERTGVSGTLAVAAIAQPDPMCPSRLASDDDSLLVVNGPAPPVDLPAEPYAVETPRAAMRGPATRATTPNPGWSFVEDERKAIEALFKEAARETDMGAICDLHKLRRMVRSHRPIGNINATRQMTNVVGIALTLLGRAEPVLDRPDEPSVPPAPRHRFFARR